LFNSFHNPRQKSSNLAVFWLNDPHREELVQQAENARCSNKAHEKCGLSGFGEICEVILEHFEQQYKARKRAYDLSQEVVRVACTCIKSIHRNESDQAQVLLAEAGKLTAQMAKVVRGYAGPRYGGFVGDPETEYPEAAVVYAVINGDPLPTPAELSIDYALWLNGLAEAGGEFRRHILDLIREDRTEEADTFLAAMGEIYHIIMGFDYANAISYGLRGRSDALRVRLNAAEAI